MEQQEVSARRLALVGTAAVSYAFFGESWGFDEYGLGRSAIDLAGGISFILAGLVAWQRRPENRTGPLMVLLGSLAWFTVNLQFADHNPIAYTIGITSVGPSITLGAYVLLAFPHGRLAEERLPRLCSWAFSVLVGVGMPLRMLFFNPINHDCEDCGPRDNLLLVTSHRAADDLAGTVFNACMLVAAAAVAFTLGWRYKRASKAGRRVFGPVLVAGAISIFSVGMNEVLAGSVVQNYGVVDNIPWTVFIVTSTLIPFAMLAGVLRTRAGRSPLGDMIVRLHNVPTGGALRDLLAEALGDPSLRIGLWAPSVGAYVDESGKELTLGATRTLVDGHDGPLAVLFHDPALLNDQRMLDAVVAAASFALENERLQAEVRAQLLEVRASRARIVEAGDEQRRRLERDLHDGAQQRLVSLALGLQLLRDRLPENDDGLRELLDVIGGEAKGAVSELRELARGIHPAILSDQGLGGALQSLAERSTVPVLLRSGLNGRRLPAAVEAAGYFVCAESLTNAAKHATASSVEIVVDADGRMLHGEIADDGVGGAELDGGTGLLGLQDRVVALGGRLDIRSPAPPAVVLTSSRAASDYGTRLSAAPAAGFVAKSEISRAALDAVLQDA
ncbi:MAG: histidine kinase [Actinobacteria bacterium]|nr:histidine kinase [Actinomycetota bacterium]